MLERLAHLLRSGETVLMFPESGRSRSGRVDTEATADGVGRLIKEVEGCRVLCVYLRGDAQRTWSNLPARGDTFTIATRLVEPRTDLRGLRASRDLATQVVRQLVGDGARVLRGPGLVSVGNDVVDLDDPETRLDGLHPRWDERVFGAAERKALEASRVAAPAALGALGRQGERLQGPEEARAADGLLADGVRGRALPPPRNGRRGRGASRPPGRGVRARGPPRRRERSRGGDERGRDRRPGPVEGRAQPRAIPSVAARRLAATAIGSALGLDPAGVRIVGRPPVATFRDRRIDVGVSLSHHGRFVAFACTLAELQVPARSCARGVPGVGFEPTRAFAHSLLRAACLPVSPPGRRADEPIISRIAVR